MQAEKIEKIIAVSVSEVMEDKRQKSGRETIKSRWEREPLTYLVVALLGQLSV